MDDDDEDRREEDAGGVHVMTDNVFPDVPRVIVGLFYRRYGTSTSLLLDLLYGMLEQRAHGVSRGTEYEEHG